MRLFHSFKTTTLLVATFTLAAIVQVGCTKEPSLAPELESPTIQAEPDPDILGIVNDITVFFRGEFQPLIRSTENGWRVTIRRGVTVVNALEFQELGNSKTAAPQGEPFNRDGLLDHFLRAASQLSQTGEPGYRGPGLPQVELISRFLNTDNDVTLFRDEDTWLLVLETSAGPLGLTFTRDFSDTTDGDVFYIATNGDDSGNGSIEAPWLTFEHAVGEVPDGSTIVVRPGTYNDRQFVVRAHFDEGIRIVSEVPYMAKLRDPGSQVLTIYDASGITIEGFDMAHTGDVNGRGLVCQVAAYNGSQFTDEDYTRNIILRNNIFHDSYNNDILKINAAENTVGRLADILVEGNMFFNQQGSDEHIDLNSCERVTIQDNIFFNDYQASGRSIGDVANFIVVKRSSSSRGAAVSRDHKIRRNIFLNYQGNENAGFMRLGEDGVSVPELEDSVIENNLFMCSSGTSQSYAIGVFGTKNVKIRHNTVVGLMSMRKVFAGIVGDPGFEPNVNLQYYNNVFSRPSSSNTPRKLFYWSNTTSATAENNMLWQGAGSWTNIPDVWNSSVEADPKLPSQSGVVVPHWNGTAFADGSTSIREAFVKLAEQYGIPAEDSPMIDAAMPEEAPFDDLLGNLRVGSPDIGAFER